MIEELMKALEFISETRNRLYQFAMFVVILKCLSIINELSCKLASQLQFKIIPDNSAVFRVNENYSYLIDQNGQKIAGDRTRQVFVSREGTCIFPNKLNNGLQYPDGKPVNLVDLVGQEFHPMTIKVNVPHQLYSGTTDRQRISTYLRTTMFGAKKYLSSPDQPKSESEQMLAP